MVAHSQRGGLDTHSLLPTVVYDSHIDLYLNSGGSRQGDAHVVFCVDLLWKEHVPNLIDASSKP